MESILFLVRLNGKHLVCYLFPAIQTRNFTVCLVCGLSWVGTSLTQMAMCSAGELCGFGLDPRGNIHSDAGWSSPLDLRGRARLTSTSFCSFWHRHGRGEVASGELREVVMGASSRCGCGRTGRGGGPRARARVGTGRADGAARGRARRWVAK